MTTKFTYLSTTRTKSRYIKRLFYQQNHLNPSKGQKEQEDLARAKQIAFEEMMGAEQANDPNEQRFCLLENRLEVVEKKMEELSSL